MTNSGIDQGLKGKRKRMKKVHEQIRKQMEFYFGDSNMGKDRFMKKLIDASPDGSVELETFLKFNRIRSLGCEEIGMIAKALTSSSMLNVSEDGKRVKRVTPIRDLADVDDRTVYVEGLPPHTNHDWVSQTFSRFGKVTYVSLPRFRSTGDLKGFAFVEFETVDSATKAVKKLKGEDTSEQEVHCFPKAGSKDIQRLAKQVQRTQEADNDDMAVETPENGNTAAVKTSDSMEDESKVKKTDEGLLPENPVESSHKPNDKPKKRKMTDSGDEIPEKRAKTDKTIEIPPKSILKVKSDAESGSESEVKKNVTLECAEVKKKRRKQKKKKKEEKNTEIRMKVMPKREWTQLREAYLASQKARMSELKKALREGSLCDDQSRVSAENKKTTKCENMTEEGAHYTFQADVIVKVKSESALHRKSLKEQLSAGDSIAYIDVIEGDQECFVRCKDADAAKEIMTKLYKGLDLSLVQGDEEKRYWTKINADRENKLSGAKRNRKQKRGHQKIIDKVERVAMGPTAEVTSPPAQKHVYFDD